VVFERHDDRFVAHRPEVLGANGRACTKGGVRKRSAGAIPLILDDIGETEQNRASPHYLE
jgi:hypothetical protein